MNATFDIRVATSDDLDALTPMYAAFIDSQFALGGIGVRNPEFDVRAYVARRLADPLFTVCAAWCGGAPAGFFDCSVQWVNGGAVALSFAGVRPLIRSLRARLRARGSNSYLLPVRQGYLHNIYVDPAFRKQRLGALMTDACVETLQRRGADHIHVHTLANNVYAQRAFTAGGFRPQTLLMRWMPPAERDAWDETHGTDD